MDPLGAQILEGADLSLQLHQLDPWPLPKPGRGAFSESLSISRDTDAG
tara:strand:- start:35 stop:178 length:144 start_codon:yes stop_codon:yes gene_type:complete